MTEILSVFTPEQWLTLLAVPVLIGFVAMLSVAAGLAGDAAIAKLQARKAARKLGQG
ncbi:MAG: hypothetical protein ABL893_14470 [Hyphomicrobium sp.]